MEPATPVQITEEHMHTSPTGAVMLDDDAATELVLQDASTGDNYININQWAAGWVQCDELYQSPQNVTAFDGSGPRASVPKFTVSNHISAIVPKAMGGLFYEGPPFLLRPRPGTSPELIRAKTALFAYQLKAMEFEQQCEQLWESQTLRGTCIAKWGWKREVKTEKSYVLKENPATTTDALGQVTEVHTEDSDDFEVEYEDITTNMPWLAWCDIRTVLVDPKTRVGDIRKAKWVIYRDFATYDDLEALRGVEGYKIPPVEQLKEFFLRPQGTGTDNITMQIPEGMFGYLQQALPRAATAATADPYGQGLEILERWDDKRVMVVLVHGADAFCIRNEENPYSRKPFLSANWRNIPNSFYGQGLGLLIGPEQMVDQGLTNLGLESIAFCLQPTAVRKRGFNALTQDTSWELGGIIDVDEDVDKAFKFLEFPQPPASAWQYLTQSQTAAQETSGANQQVMLGAGAAGIRTTGMRTAAGAGLVGQANASRLDGPVERFVRQIFVPFLQIMDELNNDRLPTSELRRILNEEMTEPVKVDHISFRNAKIEYEVLAGSHLGPKQQMSQFLPFILQMMDNPTFTQMLAQADYIFDPVAFFKAFADAAGWKYTQDFIKQMTPEQKKRATANSPAGLTAAKAQAAQQLQREKFQGEEQVQDEKQLGRAGAEALRTNIEHAMENAEPNNQVFGTPWRTTSACLRTMSHGGRRQNSSISGLKNCRKRCIMSLDTRSIDRKPQVQKMPHKVPNRNLSDDSKPKPKAQPDSASALPWSVDEAVARYREAYEKGPRHPEFAEAADAPLTEETLRKVREFRESNPKDDPYEFLRTLKTPSGSEPSTAGFKPTETPEPSRKDERR